MKEEYNFGDARKNPYIQKEIIIIVESGTIDYFKEQAERLGIPYQTLINLYLTDCAEKGKQLQMDWK